MTFKEFTSAIVTAVSARYPKHQVTTQSVLKNNGQELIGLMIRSQESNIAPTIYLDDFYQFYQKTGSELSIIVDSICSTYESNKKPEGVDTNMFTDFSNARTASATNS